MPIITLEVLPRTSLSEKYILANYTTTPGTSTIDTISNPTLAPNTMHFLTEHKDEQNNGTDQDSEINKSRSDLLHYLMRSDGSVICKMCGEVLPNRPQWYKHKQRVHSTPPATMNPAPLFQCEQCLIFFKSRKGYIGHLSSRHSEVLSDATPVLTNAQVEALAKEQQLVVPIPVIKDEVDPEIAISIPTSSVSTFQGTFIKPVQMPLPIPVQVPVPAPVPLKANTSETRKPYKTKEQTENPAEREEKRSREEKLVADIIDRVRRECEAQGNSQQARRGYSRRGRSLIRMDTS